MTLPASAAVDRSAPETVHFLGNLLTFRARAAATGGSFSMTECLTAPGAGSPPHVQADEEGFLVLDGTFEIVLDGVSRILGPGDFAFVPAGTPHAFRNPGDAPARMLIVNLPGGAHENFFLAVGEPVDAAAGFPPMGAPDVPRLVAEAARFGIDILPPAA
jgi:Mannose-6-phosphate isomerase